MSELETSDNDNLEKLNQLASVLDFWSQNKQPNSLPFLTRSRSKVHLLFPLFLSVQHRPTRLVSDFHQGNLKGGLCWESMLDSISVTSGFQKRENVGLAVKLSMEN